MDPLLLHSRVLLPYAAEGSMAIKPCPARTPMHVTSLLHLKPLEIPHPKPDGNVNMVITSQHPFCPFHITLHLHF
jgi:hypothetical protein